ncbi:MAG TPA: MFS transporter [Rhizomicrobium sp.]|jgi:MFS family permease|nr:MFS transporter [Rhizomicrobium sp.]
MAVAAESVAPARAGIGAGVVPLLALVVFINYVDRGNLATAAPLMKDELHLSASQIGLLFSAFYWTYIPSQILAGWLAERINAYRTLALGLAIWSVATATSGLATGFAFLIALRLVLGIGESAAFPCSSKLLARHLPLHKLGGANGAIATGLALGPAFGTFAGGMLMAQFGWRTIFLLFGLVSLLWLVPWLRIAREASFPTEETSRENEPSFRALLGRRELWAACVGHFSSNYAFYFVISWLPLYLVKWRGFTVAEMATLAGVIYLVYAASALVTGWLADFWMERGASANRVRKTAIIASLAGVALAMFGCAFGNATVCMASLFLAGVSFGPGSANVFAIGQTLAGPRAAGKWVGVQNCLGNISGVVGPLVTGFVIDRTGDFFWAFAVACAVTLVGIIAWGLLIPRVAPLDWSSARTGR